MNEELKDTTMEEVVEIEIPNAEEVEVAVKRVEAEVPTEETVEVITVETIEDIEIEIDEAIGWSGGDGTVHSLLIGTDDYDQHPIKAITGLRAELDEIEKLKTVYSDKTNVANYYKWKDTSYDDYGYFVSLVPGESAIKVCDGSDIFGVSVDTAGFIGGQNADVPADNSYGLIVTSGLVDVRCETDVKVGDYVVSSARGIAKKINTNYGYKVLAKENKHGVEYVVILLGIQADITNSLGEELDEIEERVGVNESNIVAAINVANQAYSKAVSSENSAAASKTDVEEALREIFGFGEELDEMEKTVASSSMISAQAKAIAESAATSAASMRDEAVEKSNEALADTVELRKELTDTATKINADLNDAVLDLKSLKEDLTPLATWPEGSDVDNATGYAGFVARADEDSSILGTMVGRKGENGETLAGFIQEAEETRATVRGIVSYEYTDKNGNPVTGAAGLMAQVDDTKSEISAVANRSFTKADGTVVTGLAGLNAQVDENESNVALVANRVAGEYTVIPELVEEDKRDSSKVYGSYDKESETTTYYYYRGNEWIATTSWADLPLNATMIYYVSATKLYWYCKDATWTFTTDAHIAGLPASIAGIQVVADDNSSSINSLTSWQGTTNTAMARIEQKADENGAYIQSTVANLDRYSVGPLSMSYGFKLDQAKSVLEKGVVYVPTENHTEKLPVERSFTKQYYYTWDGEKWITSDSVAVIFADGYQTGNANSPYWYIPGDSNITEGNVTYNAHTLYKWISYVGEDGVTYYHWVTVATLAGNSQSRAVSQIRQDANSIAFEVTDSQGSFAGMKAQLDGISSKVNSVASWPTGEGTHNMAIFEQKSDASGAYMTLAAVRNVNGEPKIDEIGGAKIVLSDDATTGSYIRLEADYINFEGSQFSSTMSKTYSTKTETSTAKDDAISAANENTENKLKDYSTTTETKSLIDQKADSISLSVSQTYSTKTETSTAKTEAIDSANSSTDNKLKNYSTTTEMNTALDLKADSATLEAYAKTTEVDDKLKGYATTTEMNSALSLKADSATLSSYATTTDVDGKISTVEGKLALGIGTDADGKKYAYLNANADRIKFDATKTIEINATNFQLDRDGNITAKSGYIGNGASGFKINSQSICNIVSNGDEYYMTTPKKLNSTSAYAGGVANGNTRDYVYIGTDGIGTLRAAYNTNGTSTITASTYIQNGALYTNTGVIGSVEYSWTIGSNATNAYLCCGTSSIVGVGGLPTSDTNNVYLGTNGLSYSLGDASHSVDYTTVVRSGHVLTYGCDAGNGQHHRATHLHYNGIQFFHAGSNAISGINNLSNHKVGHINIGTDKKLNIHAPNGLNITGGSIVVGGYTAKTGWVQVLKKHDVANNTFTYAYLRFANGILVDASTTPPPINSTWILQ